ncbi:hypothetical protein, partial [Thiolapillus sp.]|uniref:hypothetical protein n=1 Tax=Thiolapillus sp. TaxID=2017437 RepID=UPI003AF549B7
PTIKGRNFCFPSTRRDKATLISFLGHVLLIELADSTARNSGSSAEFVGSRGGFEANDQVCPVGVEHPTRSLRRWSCEAIINSEGTKWDAAQDYPEPGAEIQVICLQVGALGW